MRIAITSDIHLGDPSSTLAFLDDTGTIGPGSRYKEFVEAIRNELGTDIDYLIFAGDVLDFSVTNYNVTYAVGESFFRQLKQDHVAREIIYIPGNHDFDIWHSIEYQVNVINKFARNKLPTSFRMSVPGVIDTRKGSKHPGLSLIGVSPRHIMHKPRYAGLFLDNITNPPTPFNFAYPNLYLITEEDSILITHGQYLEQYWSMLGRWAMNIAYDDLNCGDALTMEQMVAFNFPLCQLSCSGIGQAGNLTNLVLQLEHDIKAQNFDRLDKFFSRIDANIDKILEKDRRIRLLEPLEDKLFGFLRKTLEHSLAQMGTTRYSEQFIYKTEVQKRFLEFYTASIREIEQIRNNEHYDIPVPEKVIFGHTHQPIPWGIPNAPTIQPPQLPDNRNLVLYNTGGWLQKKDKTGGSHFCGASIFIYDPKKGIRSVSIG
jgi:UDP-2,3-diacylglucosamine pyrophosphatase LpxH